MVPTAEERDGLTGLPGPQAARRQIAAWQSAAAARGQVAPVHALMLRLKRFSSVNLAYGAAAGDRALVEVAARMAHLFDAEFGQNRLLARTGGGAFLAAAAQPCSRERWEWLAEELAQAVARPIVGGDAEETAIVRLRPRIALLRAGPEDDPERIFARLADALDRVQEQAGRLLVWVDGATAEGERRAQQLEADLLGALDRGEIEVLFQPQFSCEDRRLVGAEALVRWQHPELGRIGAEALFAIAERADHVPALSRHIADSALAAASRWPAGLRLSLNVTAADLAAGDFADAMTAAVARAGFAPERLTLEITEQSLLAELDRSAQRLGELAQRGIGIALDDFGAGFCNFRYLKVLPLRTIKLDRSMVDGIGEDPRDLAVLRGIVAMAQALGLSVIAEGVETEAQRVAVAREGCAVWQGFLGAPPLAMGDFKRLVGEER